MDSISFPAVILHPNTESLLIKLRKELLSKDFKSYIPLFPLYGIFTESEYSSGLKPAFSAASICSVKGIFIFEHIIYFYGEIKSDNSALSFYIPAAIEKKTDSKTILSVFKTSFNNLKEFLQLEKIFFSEEIKFRSFQIADCHISENEYSLFENFWIKTT